MKKLHYFLSLFLLMFVAGMGSAAAQDLRYDPVTEITPGETYVLKSCTVGEGGYLNGNQALSSTIGADNYYVFETAEGEADGYPLYVLKQVSTGLYLKDQKLSKGNDSSDDSPIDGNGQYTAYTDSKAEAFTFTAQLFEEGSADPRKKANVGKDNQQDLSVQGFVFAGTYTYEYTTEEGAKTFYTYLGAIGQAFLSPWEDTNAWIVGKPREATAKEKFEAYMSNTFKVAPDATLFTVGTNPGNVSSQEVVDNLVAAYNQAVALQGKESSEAEYQEGYNAITSAYKAYRDAIVKVTPGYYFIHLNAGDRSNQLKEVDGVLKFGENFEIPATPTVDDASSIWKVVAKTDSTFTIQGFGSGSYVGDGAASQQVALTLDPEVEYTINPLDYTVDDQNVVTARPGVFSVSNLAKPNLGLHAANGQKTVVYWTYNHDFSSWKFTPVAQSVVDGLVEAVEQNKLNNKLQGVYETAHAVYVKSRSFKSNATKDSHYDDLGVVADAAQVSGNSVQEDDGSGYAGLVDGDVDTYFHSAWKTEIAPSDTYSYLQFDLGGELQTIAIKYTKRQEQQDNANPKLVRIYGSKDGETWTNAGDYTLTYNYALETTNDAGEPTTSENQTGILNVEFDQPYKYVRFEVLANTLSYNNPSSQAVNGYPFFYLSELHIYDAEYDPATSGFENVSEATRTEFVSQLTKASEELEAGKATQTTVDALQKAYDAFVKEFPDVEIINNALKVARTYATNAVEGEGYGYFAAGSVQAYNDALDAVANTVKESMTVAQINEGVANIAAAKATFNAALGKPAFGVPFTAVSASDDASYPQINGSYLNAANNGEGVTARWTGNSETVAPDPENGDANYVWILEDAGEGKCYVRNLGTGFYLTNEGTRSSQVKTSATPQAMNIWSAGEGMLNIEVAEGLYANTQPASAEATAGNIVAWNAGTGNSAFTFQDANLSGTVNYNVTPNNATIVTLPYAISAGVSTGTLYSVLGQNEGNLVLKAYAEDAIIAAGEPFILKTKENLSEGETVEPFLLADVNDLYVPNTFVAEGLTTETGLVGTITGTTLKTAGFGYLRGGKVLLTNGKNDVNISANSGYLKDVPTTTEAGDATLVLAGVISGINDAVIVDSNAPVNVYNISGVLVRKGVKGAAAVKGLPSGLYIVNGKKVLVK